LQSSGDLENDENIAGVITKMLQMAAKIPISGDRTQTFKRMSGRCESVFLRFLVSLRLWTLLFKVALTPDKHLNSGNFHLRETKHVKRGGGEQGGGEYPKVLAHESYAENDCNSKFWAPIFGLSVIIKILCMLSKLHKLYITRHNVFKKETRNCFGASVNVALVAHPIYYLLIYQG